MDDADALKRIRELVALGAFTFTRSCKDGMRSRGITTSEVYEVVNGFDCVSQENGTWLFEGTVDTQDAAIRVVVAIRLTPENEVRFVSAHLVT